jgi:kinesin family protein 1
VGRPGGAPCGHNPTHACVLVGAGQVEASMLEIYMEKIRDLFDPKAADLKIRNDPKKGFYVETLTRNAVANYASIDKLMEAGTKARTVASTQMNATSSRAHTIFQIVLTQTKVDVDAGKATDKARLASAGAAAGALLPCTLH